jgi:hypothetical protein
MNPTMTTVMRFRPRRIFLSLTLTVVFASLAFGQAKPTISVEHVWLQEAPIQLTGLEVAGESHELAESSRYTFSASFDSPGDWLRRLAFKVKNRSEKIVVSVMLNGSLAVGEEGEIPMGIDVRFGQELDESSFGGRSPRGEPRQLAPGETADVRWSDEDYAQLAKFLSTKHPVDSYRKMRINVYEVRFADGTVWSQGKLYRINPLDPRKWTPLDKASPNSKESSLSLKADERVLEISDYKPDSDQNLLAISEINIAGHPIAPGLPFTADQDWLRSLTVRVKNTSAKPMAIINLGFGLPEVRYHDGGVGFQLYYSTKLAGGAHVAPGAKPLLPGEETELSFTDSDYEGTRRLAEKLGGVSNFSRVRMGMASVVYADGTRAFVINPARAPRITK